MKPKAIIFDFDGVLTVGGEGLKQEAWGILQLPCLYEVQQILTEKRKSISGGKGSRYDILRQTFAEFFGTTVPRRVEILTLAYVDCYNTIVQKLLEASGMPEGTVEVLERLSKICPLYVNSATPEKSVQESVEKFGIARFFAGVFGQPTSKLENLKRILAEIDRQPASLDPLPSQLVFIGDGKGDLQAAKEFGCKFIGVANEWNGWGQGEPREFPVVASIRFAPIIIDALA